MRFKNKAVNKQFKSPQLSNSAIQKASAATRHKSDYSLIKFKKIGLNLTKDEHCLLLKSIGQDKEIDELVEQIFHKLPRIKEEKTTENRKLAIAQKAYENHSPSLLNSLTLKWKEAIIQICNDMKDGAAQLGNNTHFSEADGGPQQWRIDTLFSSLGYKVEDYYLYNKEFDSLEMTL